MERLRTEEEINHATAAKLYAANQVKPCRSWGLPQRRVRFGIWLRRNWQVLVFGTLAALMLLGAAVAEVGARI